MTLTDRLDLLKDSCTRNHALTVIPETALEGMLQAQLREVYEEVMRWKEEPTEALETHVKSLESRLQAMKEAGKFDKRHLPLPYQIYKKWKPEFDQYEKNHNARVLQASEGKS